MFNVFLWVLYALLLPLIQILITDLAGGAAGEDRHGVGPLALPQEPRLAVLLPQQCAVRAEVAGQQQQPRLAHQQSAVGGGGGEGRGARRRDLGRVPEQAQHRQEEADQKECFHIIRSHIEVTCLPTPPRSAGYFTDPVTHLSLVKHN